MTDVLVVLGTRPELVKLAPVVGALRRAALDVAVVLTGQHADLLDEATLAAIGPATNLSIKSDGAVLRFTARAKAGLRATIAKLEPKCVVVQGDTMSAHAGALAAASLDVPIAHVEAGLRSGDLHDPWPEEGIRTAIGRLATWHYAPTTVAALRLDAELRGKAHRAHEVLVCGNTSIDALRLSGVTPRAEASPTVLITLHRRELREAADVRETLQGLLSAIGAMPVHATWPVHPAMPKLLQGLVLPTNLTLCAPVPHADMLHALAEARGVLTDSGGVVEEAAALGVPTAVLRNVTDRPEAEEAGIARRFRPTSAGAFEAWHTLARCRIPRVPTDVFGDGHAAERIALHLRKALR